jgi:hypothetical protein
MKELQLTEKWVLRINESAIVGDLEIQYRVNEDGTLNLRLFNRRMIIILDKELAIPKELVLHEVDFDTFKELIRYLQIIK